MTTKKTGEHILRLPLMASSASSADEERTPPPSRNEGASRDARGSFDETDMTHLPGMKRSRAFEILKSYALVLRRVPLFITALPQSLLRHDKDVIKRAIKTAVSFLKEDKYTTSTLEDAYGSLALFVPDEKASLGAEAEDSYTPETVDDDGAGPIDRQTRIRQEIYQDRQALIEEFRRFLETP
jgi:hypothetical protein